MFWIFKSFSPETARTVVRRGPMCGLMTATEEETKSGPSTQAFDFKKYFDFIEYRSGLQHLIFLWLWLQEIERSIHWFQEIYIYTKYKLFLRLNIQCISAESFGLILHVLGRKLYNIKRFPYWQTFPTKPLEK